MEPPPYYQSGQPSAAPPPPPPARRSSGRLWTILTAAFVVLLLLVLVAAYGVAGYVTAGSKLTTANNAIDATTGHRTAFDDAPSTFDIQRSDAKAFQADAAAWVKTWTTESTVIADDDLALTAAGSKLHNQQWLTFIRKGSLDSASSRIGHAHKAMDAAKTIAANRQAEGAFLLAYANVFNDLQTFITKAQGGDSVGALAAASQLPADTAKAVSLAGDPQFPSELTQYMQAVATEAKDLVDYLNALTKGDAAAVQALRAKTNQDFNAAQLIDISQVSTKVDEFYQPNIDTYHQELTQAAGG